MTLRLSGAVAFVCRGVLPNPSAYRSKDLWLSARRRPGRVSQRAHPGGDCHLDRHRGRPPPKRAGSSTTAAHDDCRCRRGADERRHCSLLWTTSRDVNIRSTFIHMLGDTLSTAAVIVGGLAILLTGHNWIDPVLSLFIAALILWSSLSIVRETLNILLEGTPRGCSWRRYGFRFKPLRGSKTFMTCTCGASGHRPTPCARTLLSRTSRRRRARAFWSR